MKKTKSRLKANAQDVPQTREQVQNWIKQLGDTQRELGRTETLMNDEVAKITDDYTPQINRLKDRAKELLKGIQFWCEANRAELTDGKSKTVNLVTGKISWRARPPSVRLTKIDSVLESLRTLGLQRFIRSKEEVNKDAMLAEPEIAQTVAGVSIKTGIEDFVVEPFEQGVE